MPLLSPTDQEQVCRELAPMTSAVTVLFFTQVLDGEACLQTREILDELPPLSPHITIEEADFVLDPAKAAEYGIDRVPAIALLGRSADGHIRDSKIRFLGIPAGYEFAALLRAVLLVGGGPSQLSQESRDLLARVNRPVTVRVFSTPTCPHCPRAINVAHEMAFANPQITAFAVEVTEYPDLADRYRVTGVPKTVVESDARPIADAIQILGALPESAFVEQALADFLPREPGEAGAAS